MIFAFDFVNRKKKKDKLEEEEVKKYKRREEKRRGGKGVGKRSTDLKCSASKNQTSTIRQCSSIHIWTCVF